MQNDSVGGLKISALKARIGVHKRFYENVWLASKLVIESLIEKEGENEFEHEKIDVKLAEVEVVWRENSVIVCA